MDLLYTAHVPAGDGPFPTILALHGWGASAHDLIGLAPILHGGQALVLSPQGPYAFEIAQGMLGFGWFPLGEEREIDPQAFQQGADLIRSFLDGAVDRYPIDPRKVVVVGFSQGGVMAYDLVLSDPSRFAGLIGLSTWLPDAVLDANPAQPELENFPALLIHGTEDPMIPLARGHESRDKLQARGLSVAYREFEMGHEIRPEALRDILTWLEDMAFNIIQLA